ncbi:hypothetical protein BU14_0389s0006, partial [Porphyra umbilicalis]
ARARPPPPGDPPPPPPAARKRQLERLRRCTFTSLLTELAALLATAPPPGADAAAAAAAGGDAPPAPGGRPPTPTCPTRTPGGRIDKAAVLGAAAATLVAQAAGASAASAAAAAAAADVDELRAERSELAADVAELRAEVERSRAAAGRLRRDGVAMRSALADVLGEVDAKGFAPAAAAVGHAAPPVAAALVCAASLAGAAAGSAPPPPVAVDVAAAAGVVAAPPLRDGTSVAAMAAAATAAPPPAGGTPAAAAAAAATTRAAAEAAAHLKAQLLWAPNVPEPLPPLAVTARPGPQYASPAWVSAPGTPVGGTDAVTVGSVAAAAPLQAARAETGTVSGSPQRLGAGAHHAVARAAPCGGCPTHSTRKRSGSPRDTGLPADQPAGRGHAPTPLRFPLAVVAVVPACRNSARVATRTPPHSLPTHPSLHCFLLVASCPRSCPGSGAMRSPADARGARTARQTTRHDVGGRAAARNPMVPSRSFWPIPMRPSAPSLSANQDTILARTKL